MRFTVEDVRRVLGDREDDESSAVSVISRSFQGPGLIDWYDTLVDGNPDGFIHVASTPLVQPHKKKVFISCDYVSQFPHTQAAEEFFLALINDMQDQYDIYLWQGTYEKSLQTPISNASFFWEHKDLIQNVSQKDVEHAISSRGINPKECIILDEKKYSHSTELSPSFFGQDHPLLIYDLTRLDSPNFQKKLEMLRLLHEKSPDYFHAIRQVRILDEHIRDPTILQLLSTFFPKVTKVSIEDAIYHIDRSALARQKTLEKLLQPESGFESYGSWSDTTKQPDPKVTTQCSITANNREDLSYLNRVEWLDLGTSVSILKMPPRLKTLCISNNRHTSLGGTPSIPVIDLAGCSDLRELLAQKYFYKYRILNVSACHHLRHASLLAYTAEQQMVLQDLDPNSLRSLDVFYADPGRTCPTKSFARFTELLSLSIACTRLTAEILSTLPKKLKSLKLRAYGEFDSVDFSPWQQLTSLMIEHISTTHLILPASIKDLLLFSGKFTKITIPSEARIESLCLHSLDNAEAIFSSQVSLLRHLSMVLCTINSFPDMSFPELESLEIDACNELTHLDLTKFPKLRHLTIRNCEKLNPLSISHLPNLEQLDLSFDKKKSCIACEALPSLKWVHLGIKSHDTATVTVSNCPALQSLDAKGFYDAQLTIELKTLCPNLRVLTTNLSFPPTIQGEIPSSTYTHGAYTLTSMELRQVLRSQAFANQSVALYQPYEALPVDTRTGDTLPLTAKKCSLTIEMLTTPPKTKQDYRLDIMTRDQYEFSGIPKSLQPCRREDISAFNLDRAKASFDIGCVKGTLSPKVYYALPTIRAMQPDEIKIYCNNPAIEFYWDKERMQFYAHCTSEASDVNISITLSRTPPTSLPTNPSPKEGWMEPDLRAELKKNLKEMLSRLKEKSPSALKEQTDCLESILDETKGKKERLAVLIDYCQNKIQQGPLLNDQALDSPLKILLAIIEQMRGVCRHKSEVFVLLAHYIGVPAQIAINEQHAFVEVRDDDHSLWRSIDLGGGRFEDLTPPERRESILDKMDVPSKTEAHLSETKKIDYSPIFKASLNIAEVQSFQDLLQKPDASAKKQNLLIRIEAPTDPMDMGQMLLAHLRTIHPEQFKKTFYVDSVQDLKLLLNPVRLTNGRLEKLPSPIIAGTTLIINWDHFSPSEIATYSSLSDDPPTLSGSSVTDFHIIGLIRNDKEYYTSFLSRHRQCVLSETFTKQITSEPLTPPSTESSSPIIIDLFHRPNWKSLLIATPTLSEQSSINLANGPLIEAILQKRPLIIQNPPDDDAFRLLMLRLQKEKRILYNGSFVDIPSEFYFTTESHPPSFSVTNITFQSLSECKDREAIYLSLQNWHECFEQVTFQPDGSIRRKDGLLKSISEQQYFYITENIPAEEWEYFLSKTQELIPGKMLRVLLAPGVVLANGSPFEKVSSEKESIISYEAITDWTKQPVRLFLSNDPDFFSKTMRGHDHSVEILQVSPQTTFQELIESVERKDPASPDIHFSRIEHGLLQQLRNGKNIILNGEVSPSLYQQLLPWLSEPPRVYCNGERETTVTGRLILVMPEAARQHLNIAYGVSKTYTLDDYNGSFSNDQESSQAFQQIKQFIALAEKLALRKEGIPDHWVWTHDHLMPMVQSVIAYQRHSKESIDHAHNPIKAWGHYDFPKDSEDYAYLNVIAKVMFEPPTHETQPPSTKQKMKLYTLMWRFQIDPGYPHTYTHHLWQLLNCLNGDQLKQYLSEAVLKKIQEQAGSQGVPSLDPAMYSSLPDLMRNVKSTYQSEADASSVSLSQGHEKSLMRLKAALNDPKTPLIFLKGPPGAGKSYAVRYELPDEARCHEDVLAWLNDTSPGKKVLLIDEGNLAAPGSLEILKQLLPNSDSPSTSVPTTLPAENSPDILSSLRKILRDNPNLKISSEHKIVVTGNQENAMGRYYQEVLRTLALTIYTPPPSDKELTDNILKPTLPESLMRYSNTLLKIYHTLSEQEAFPLISQRNLANLTHRFALLAQSTSTDASSKQALFEASYEEFHGLLPNKQDREILKKQLAKLVGLSPSPSPLGDADTAERVGPYVYPKSRTPLLEAVRQAFAIRDMATAETLSHDRSGYHRMVLIEGASGLGKSTLYEALLVQQGFTNAPLPPKADEPIPIPDGPASKACARKFYKIPAGHPSLRSTLIAAYREGAMVILDEINAVEAAQLEKLINPLLDKAKAEPKNGFMILTSQNEAGASGRFSQSTALRNRAHFLFMEDYTDKELCTLARELGITSPTDYVQSFRASQELYGSACNMRTFFLAARDAELPITSPAITPTILTHNTPIPSTQKLTPAQKTADDVIKEIASALIQETDETKLAPHLKQEIAGQPKSTQAKCLAALFKYLKDRMDDPREFKSRFGRYTRAEKIETAKDIINTLYNSGNPIDQSVLKTLESNSQPAANQGNLGKLVNRIKNAVKLELKPPREPTQGTFLPHC